MQNKQSAKFLRKRKFMLVLPLLTIPFLTMAFWALGGGKGSAQNNQTAKLIGLNLDLPDAKLGNEKGQDKLSFYNKAEEDSIKLRQEMQNDPFYKNGLDTMEFSMNPLPTNGSTKLNLSPYHSSGVTSPTEVKIYERLDALNKTIQQPEENKLQGRQRFDSLLQTGGQDDFSGDVDRLENMMEVMSNKDGDDPEMKQIGTMLDKILDVQHPERVKDRIKEKSLKNKDKVYAISKYPAGSSVSLLDTSKKKSIEQTGFYGTEPDDVDDEQNAIEAVIHENQTLVNGAVVKLRLLNDIYISGKLIPKERFVFGLCSLNGERLEIEINSIRSGSSLFPVKFEVFDMDGLQGIYIPGAISRDVAKQSADNSLQLMELSTMDPTLKAQAAGAGISAARNLLSRKVKLIKVAVKAGYKVLLRDKKFDQ